MNSLAKKSILLLLLATLSWGKAHALGDIFKWGLTGGVNITKAMSDDPGFMNTGWLFRSSDGYYLGASMRVSIPLLNLGFDASFTYSQELAELGSNGHSVSDRLRYFSMPVHVRYDFELPGLCEVLIPYVFTGPQCNFALNDFDWYSLVKMDEESRLQLDEAMNNLTEHRNWKWDIGFGAILGSRIQVHYNYAIPVTNAFHLQTMAEEYSNHFKLGTHRIGLTFFF